MAVSLVGAAACSHEEASNASQSSEASEPSQLSEDAQLAEAAVDVEPPSVEDRLRAETADWRGTPYRWGGESHKGIDCSAFTRTVFDEAFELSLPRSAEDQERMGTPVARGALQPGDLVFFKTGGMFGMFKRRHVGIYVGEGEFAHASSSQGVTISKLSDPYWSREYKTARRVLPPDVQLVTAKAVAANGERASAEHDVVVQEPEDVEAKNAPPRRAGVGSQVRQLTNKVGRQVGRQLGRLF